MHGRLADAASDYEAAYRLLAYPTFANARLFLVLRELGRLAEAQQALDDARRNLRDDP